MLQHKRKGFTLIELLIVVVIIGILAAIAIPKFATTKEKAYVASMKSDLKNLSTAQEAYFADYTAYKAGTASNTTGSVSPIAGFAYAPSVGVTVTVSATGGTGWSATATHTGWGAGTKTCAIFIGVASVSPATNEGEPKCQT